MSFLIGLLFSVATEYITYLLVGFAFLLYWMKNPATTAYQKLMRFFAASAGLTSLMLFNKLLEPYPQPTGLPVAAFIAAMFLYFAGASMLARGIHKYRTATWTKKKCGGKFAGGFLFLLGLLPPCGALLLTLKLMLAIEHATTYENEVTRQAVRTEVHKISNVILVAESLNTAIAADLKPCNSKSKWVWTCSPGADASLEARAASMQLKGVIEPFIEQEKAVEKTQQTTQQASTKSTARNIPTTPPRAMIGRNLLESLTPDNKEKLYVSLDSMRLVWLKPEEAVPDGCSRTNDPFRLDAVKEVECTVKLKVDLVDKLGQNEGQQRQAKLQDPQQLTLLLFELLTVVMSVLDRLAALQGQKIKTAEDEEDEEEPV